MSTETLSGRLLRAQDRLEAAKLDALYNPCVTEREAATSRVLRAQAEVSQITKAMEARLRREAIAIRRDDGPEAA
jgi:hypothetical protein